MAFNWRKFFGSMDPADSEEQRYQAFKARFLHEERRKGAYVKPEDVALYAGMLVVCNPDVRKALIDGQRDAASESAK